VRGSTWQTIAIALCVFFALAPTLDAFGRQGTACPARTKIVGGKRAKGEAWPFLVELRLVSPNHSVGRHHCGGTIIAPDWVLTAGHCLLDVSDPKYPMQIVRNSEGKYVHKETGYELQVVIGVDDLVNVAAENVLEVADVKIHDLYKGSPAETGHDIALIRLKSPWTGRLARLSLSQATDPAEDEQSLLVAGFGDTVETQQGGQSFTTREPLKFDSSSQTLLETTIPAVPLLRCRQSYAKAAIGAGQICAGYEAGGYDSCQGDSGGPLVVKDTRGCSFQVGLVSWGQGCARAKLYGVYTRISQEADWIRRYVPDVVAVEVDDTVKATAAEQARKALIDAAVRQLEDEFAERRNRIKIAIKGPAKLAVGARYKFEVESPVAGRLVLIDIDAGYAINQIFPNSFENLNSPTRLSANTPLIIPTEDNGTEAFEAVEPIGKGRALALVVPDTFPISSTLASKDVLVATKGFKPVPRPTNYVLNVLSQVVNELEKTSNPNGAAKANNWAFGVLDYEIER